jgi:hypothetical protein
VLLRRSTKSVGNGGENFGSISRCKLGWNFSREEKFGGISRCKLGWKDSREEKFGGISRGELGWKVSPRNDESAP